MSMKNPSVLCSNSPTKGGYGYSCNQINPLLKEQPHKFCPPYSYFTCGYSDCFVVVSRRGGNNFYNKDGDSSAQHVSFVMNEPFQITLNLHEDKTFVLHEHNHMQHGVRFVLTKRSQHSWISFNRIDSGGGNINIDIEASVLFPPEWKIDDFRGLFAIVSASETIASNDDEIVEFMQNIANNGNEEMRDQLEKLHSRWIPVKIDSFSMNTGEDNEVQAFLLQLPQRPHTKLSTPFNIDISIKQK